MSQNFEFVVDLKKWNLDVDLIMFSDGKTTITNGRNIKNTYSKIVS